jgi:hypothetical protein
MQTDFSGGGDITKPLIIHNTTHDKKKPTTDKISTNSSMTF